MEPCSGQTGGQTQPAGPAADDENVRTLHFLSLFKRFTRGMSTRPPGLGQIFCDLDSHFPLNVIQNERTMSFKSSQKDLFLI